MMANDDHEDNEIIDVKVEFIPDRADLAYFWKMYEMEQKYHAGMEGGKQVIWGKAEKSKRVCRFCHRDSTGTSFHNRSHAIPALMGNKTLFTDYECDECNKIFGTYENDLSNFAGIWHTLSMVEGRKGVPTFKYDKNDFIVKGEEGGIRISIDKSKGDRAGQVSIIKEKLIIDTFKLPFVPMDAFKAFVKIALTFMNEKTIEDYEKTRRWLIGEIANKDINPHPYFYVPRSRGKKNFPSPLVILMRKRETVRETPFAIPEHCLLLFYGVFIYQIFIPFNRNEEIEFKKGMLFLPIEEHLCEEIPSSNPLGAANIQYMNMGAKVKVKNVEEKIKLPFVKL